MPAPFPETNMSTMVDLFQYGNTVTSSGGYHFFGDAMVLTVWLVMTLQSTGGFGFGGSVARPLLVSSLVTFVFATMLNLINLVDTLAVTLPLAGLVIAGVVEILQRD